MNKKKMFIVPSVALATIIGTGLLATGYVEAYNGNRGEKQTVFERLAEKFNLNKEEVKKFAEENRAQRQNNMQANFEARLNQAVKDGKITEEQKKLILEKHQEMLKVREQHRAEHQNLSVEERQKERQKRYEELKQWADQNGIDMQYMFEPGKGMVQAKSCKKFQ